MKRLMVPPLPAASRPSNTITTRWPVSFTHDCSFSSSTCSRYFCFSYALRRMRLRYGYTAVRQSSTSSSSPCTGGVPNTGSSCSSSASPSATRSSGAVPSDTASSHSATACTSSCDAPCTTSRTAFTSWPRAPAMPSSTSNRSMAAASSAGARCPFRAWRAMPRTYSAIASIT